MILLLCANKCFGQFSWFCDLLGLRRLQFENQLSGLAPVLISCPPPAGAARARLSIRAVYVWSIRSHEVVQEGLNSRGGTLGWAIDLEAVCPLLGIGEASLRLFL